MRFNVEIEYSLIVLRCLSRGSDLVPVAAQEISRKEGYPLPYVQKILKRLSKRGIVHSVQGRAGGYVLARAPQDITLKEIIEAVEDEVFRVNCEPPHVERIICTHGAGCSLRPIWSELGKIIGVFLEGVTLQTLLNSEEAVRVNLKRPRQDLIALRPH